MSEGTWKTIAEKKRNDLNNSIPQEWRIPAELLPPESQDDVTTWPGSSGWFTKKELAITELTASELVLKLASGEFSSEAVVRAFGKRAAAAHQLTNCLSETCFDRAIATAKARDEHLTKTGKPVGPLHGLPVSLKDNFNIKGLDATVGFASHVGDAAEDDSMLAKLIEEAGGILYVKTNVPTAMMIAETVNNVFGRTLNPRNRKTTCGGSSGGESALISFKGSPLGVGSDIGGSLRIPAACTGIFTLRPSFGRFPTRDCRSGMPGQETVNSVNGPMARTLADIALYSEILIKKDPWLRDSKCVPIPWRPAQLPAKLKVGVMWNDGLVKPTPPIQRALKQTVEKLRAAGVEVIDWEPIDLKQSAQLIGRMFQADGAEAIRRELEKTGEPHPPEMTVHKDSKPISVYDLWQLQYERSVFQNKNLERWNETGIDALLLPNNPVVTFKHGGTSHIPYTSTFNILDYSAVSFPTGFAVDKKLDQLPADYSPFNDVCKAINTEYDAETLDGLPISLQLVGRRFEEEKVLAMTDSVLRALA